MQLPTKLIQKLKEFRKKFVGFSSKFTKTILSKTVGNDGMSNVIQHLIGGSDASNNKTHSIGIRTIRQEIIGQQYTLLQELYQTKENTLLIGILENTGTYDNVYNTAIREAQKTSNFAEMVQNIRHIKQLKAYNPIFLPASDYLIQPYSMAIVLERISA